MKFITAILGLAVLSLATAILPDKCSIDHCGKNGAAAPCTQTSPFAVTTCYKWSKTSESRLQCRKLNCKYLSCYFIPVLASDGKLYCTSCHIHQVGCKTGFKVYGPVSSPPFVPSSRQVDASRQVDEVEQVAVTERSIRLPTCSVPFCSMSGRSAKCLFRGIKLATCAIYAKTEDKKRACDFACIQICVDPHVAPVDNFGKKYCSVCHLRQASCHSDFKIFQVKHLTHH